MHIYFLKTILYIHLYIKMELNTNKLNQNENKIMNYKYIDKKYSLSLFIFKS